MTHKPFVLNLEKDKVEILDLYCSKNGISRTDLFRSFVNHWIEGAKKEVISDAKSIVSYLGKYENTRNFQETNYGFYRNKDKKPLNLDTREQLKEVAQEFGRCGFGDVAVLLLDISLWQRYLEKHPKELISFSDYVDRRYTNPNGSTY